MIKSGVYMLANSNLIEVDSDFDHGFITVYYCHLGYETFTTFRFNYLFSDAEYLGEL